MSIRSNIINLIEKHLGEPVVSDNSVSGGCIANSKIIRTESGKKYFLKTIAGPDNMFLKESNGLRELAKANAIRIPKVQLAHNNFLLLENIETGNKPGNFFTEFGSSYAQMHRYTSKNFGFFEDNFIGATPQYNIPTSAEASNWPEFYYQKRILAQYLIAERQGIATEELRKVVSVLEHKIEDILRGSEEAPALLHGDLWSGNYMCDMHGKAVLIDPAVYYGHREADLAMTRMFGGFTAGFYLAYQNVFPLKDGWQFRERIYLAYHYLNHFNLFGGGYYEAALRLLDSYL